MTLDGPQCLSNQLGCSSLRCTARRTTPRATACKLRLEVHGFHKTTQQWQERPGWQDPVPHGGGAHLHAGGSVLNGEAVGGRQTQTLGCRQEDIRRRLAALHLPCWKSCLLQVNVLLQAITLLPRQPALKRAANGLGPKAETCSWHPYKWMRLARVLGHVDRLQVSRRRGALDGVTALGNQGL